MTQRSPLDLASTFYFLVGSVNWAGARNFTSLGKLNFQITPSQTALSFGSIDITAGPASVVNATGITIASSSGRDSLSGARAPPAPR